MRALIVEDEPRLADTLRDLLTMNGYTADVCHDGESGLDNALSGIYDVVLLDVMLPKLDGFTVVRRLREAENATPVLLLTARSELSDRVTGQDCGADYYLTKPFEPRELLACLRAISRRGGTLQSTEEVRFGDLILSKDTFSLSCAERSVHLSRKEFDLCHLLMRSGTQVITKESILLKIWGYESDAEDNNVEVYISFLRRKLTHLKSTVKIRTIRMVGYRLEAGT